VLNPILGWGFFIGLVFIPFFCKALLLENQIKFYPFQLLMRNGCRIPDINAWLSTKAQGFFYIRVYQQSEMKKQKISGERDLYTLRPDGIEAQEYTLRKIMDKEGFQLQNWKGVLLWKSVRCMLASGQGKLESIFGAIKKPVGFITLLGYGEISKNGIVISFGNKR